MEGPAPLSLVLGMSIVGSKLVSAMGELALLSILAMPRFLQDGRTDMRRDSTNREEKGFSATKIAESRLLFTVSAIFHS